MKVVQIQAEPLTSDAFEPFGQVVGEDAISLVLWVANSNSHHEINALRILSVHRHQPTLWSDEVRFSAARPVTHCRGQDAPTRRS